MVARRAFAYRVSAAVLTTQMPSSEVSAMARNMASDARTARSAATSALTSCTAQTTPPIASASRFTATSLTQRQSPCAARTRSVVVAEPLPSTTA
jgi:hypothetical protein